MSKVELQTDGFREINEISNQHMMLFALTGSPGLGHLHQVRQGAALAAVRRDDEGESHSLS